MIAEERVASNVTNISPVVERVVAYLRMDPRGQEPMRDVTFRGGGREVRLRIA